MLYAKKYLALQLSVILFFIHFADAQSVISAQQQTSRYLARIELNTADELMGALKRAEQLFELGGFQSSNQEPVVFVLHGPEAKAFLNKNYRQYKELVDLAARLSAFNVVDIKVCEAWTDGEGLDVSGLPPFVGTVPFGPDEEKRLMEQEGYIYF